MNRRPEQPNQDQRGGVRRRLAGLLVVACVLVTGMTACTSSRCGDYDLRGGQYVSNPGRGDYVKEGDDYRFVGCSRSGTGGPIYGPGGSTRGGGSGSGK